MARPRRKYIDPVQFLAERDEERVDLVAEAKRRGEQGMNYEEALELGVISLAAQRAYGNAEKALSIFDWEMEQIRRNETLEGIENIKSILLEIAPEYAAAK